MARRKQQSGLDDFFKFLVAMPWWAGPICAALAFLFFRLLIPAIVGSVGKPDDPMAKGFDAVLVPLSIRLAPYASLFVLAIWGMAEAKKLANRKRLDDQTGLDSISDLSWQEFEELVAEAFRREGYAVERTGNAAGDGGVDVVLRRKSEKTVVQCKHWKTWTVGVSVIRDLRGAMADEKADYGIVVSYGTFTPEAEAYAERNRITLIGGEQLDTMIKAVQKAPRVPVAAAVESTSPAAGRGQPTARPTMQDAPACPRCGTTMVVRTAKRGANAGSQFWACPRYPDCQGTRPM